MGKNENIVLIILGAITAGIGLSLKSNAKKNNDDEKEEEECSEQVF